MGIELIGTGITESFNKIFQNKGNVAPIAEKSIRNFSKLQNSNHLFYFAIGHKFKNIDTENVFGYELDENLKKKIPTRFLSIQKKYFDFENELLSLLKNIRNLNSHYVHIFDVIEVSKIDNRILNFLRESFELATVYTYLNENELSYIEFYNDDNKDKKYVKFLCDKFFPNQEFQINERKIFLQKTKAEALDHLLFVQVDKDFSWQIMGAHPVLTIKKGKYLTFNSCLFLLCTFLYKDEANKLISNIKGFKRNDDRKFKSKRNIFSFFSKKFSSQDINSEEQNLVKFRDIINYLNNYPVIWNKEMELESAFPVMTDQLKKYIIETEVNRSFPHPDNENKQKFLLYVIKNVFGDEYLKYWNLSNDINFSADEIKKFDFILNTRPWLKDKIEKKELLQNKKNVTESDKLNTHKEIKKLTYEIRTAINENDANPVKVKLLNRINNNLLFSSYGRNQDRFMDFAVRFLAESNYFGSDAEFKMYQFFNIEEQEEYLEETKKSLSKKEFEKLKYHKGKLTHFSTYQNHLIKYPDWDTPFVKENNAVNVIVNLVDDKGETNIKKNVAIQRNLMIYFLQDAFDNINRNKDLGKNLLNGYYKFHQKDFQKSISVLEQFSSDTVFQKNKFKQLIPRRLLNNYSPAVKNEISDFNSLEMILETAEKHEVRYQALLQKAITNNNEENFLKRNKGKKFKLQFVRKVWNIIYFKDIYVKNVEASEHHKRFHISKEEFNDFSRWMYAFDEVPEYKTYLQILFEQKSFFDNSEFEDLFLNASSLDDLFHKTKSIYLKWLKNNPLKTKEENKYSINNYTKFFNDNLFYINVPHFIGYLESKSKIKRNDNNNIKYNSSENIQYLIDVFYYKDKLNKEEYKTCGKLYNKLKKAKLEDALLYELAFYYIGLEKNLIKKTKTKLQNILTNDVEFDIKDKNGNHLYNLIIPFNKIESFSQIMMLKEDNEYLINIINYLEKVRYLSDIKKVYEQYKYKNYIKYEDLNTINSHIITNSQKYSSIALILEQYLIASNKIIIPSGKNRIDFDEIQNLNKYINKKDRNNAFHFNIPDLNYIESLKNTEKNFITAEIDKSSLITFNDLPADQKIICAVFLRTLHDNLYDRKNNPADKFKAASEKYFNKIINP